MCDGSPAATAYIRRELTSKTWRRAGRMRRNRWTCSCSGTGSTCSTRSRATTCGQSAAAATTRRAASPTPWSTPWTRCWCGRLSSSCPHLMGFAVGHCIGLGNGSSKPAGTPSRIWQNLEIRQPDTAAWHRGTLTNLTCRCPCPRTYAAGQRHGCRAQPDHIPSLRS